jgi:hypothetical protein
MMLASLGIGSVEAAVVAARSSFCGECGSSLFWDPPGDEAISIAAGTLDPPTGLRIVGHWYTHQASDYYDIPDDGLPHHKRSG